MNQNEVNLILSRLESIELNQVSNQKRIEDWINKIESRTNLIYEKMELRLDTTERKINNVKLKVTGIVSIMGMVATIFGAWVNKNFFH